MNLNQTNYLKHFKYQQPEIDSIIQYHREVIRLTNAVFIHLQKFDIPNETVTLPNPEINLKLDKRENSLIDLQWKLLSRELTFNFDRLKRQIQNIKLQSIRFQSQLDIVNSSKDSLANLADLESTHLPRFKLLVEDVSEMVNREIDNLNFFLQHREFVQNFIETWRIWREDFISFCGSAREDFLHRCTANQISQDTAESLFEQWYERRMKIELMFLRLVEFMLKRNPNLTMQAIQTFQKYRDALKNPDPDFQTIDEQFSIDLFEINSDATDDEIEFLCTIDKI